MWICERGTEKPSDSGFGELGERIEKGLESLQTGLADLNTLGQVAASQAEAGTGEIASQATLELLQSNQSLREELAELRQGQGELEIFLKELIHSKPHAAGPDDSALQSRFDLVIDELKNARSGIETLAEQSANWVAERDNDNAAAEKIDADFLAAYEKLAGQVARLESERDQLRQKIEAAPPTGQDSPEEVKQLRRLLDDAREDLQRAQAELNAMRREGAAGQGGGNEALIVEFSRLEEERDELRQKIQAIESRETTVGGDEELQDRLHIALDELRQAQQEIARLEDSASRCTENASTYRR